MTMELTGKERIERTLKRQPIDRIGASESFWGDTRQHWIDQGHLGEDEDIYDHFKFDMRSSGCFKMVADIDFEEEIVEETDETKLVRDGNGALLRHWKGKSGTPEHVDFTVKNRKGWDELIRPKLIDTDSYRKRINFEGYRELKDKCRSKNLFFTWAGTNVFEQMHPVCGHEYMLMGMALDPDWVKDMCDVYSQLTIDLMEILFAEEGKPDGIWFYEDMGFKQKPFMSPQMYMEIIFPAHKRTFGYAHSMDLPVIVHSCGYVEPLVDGLIEAGMDCLQAMEVKAGMDLVKLKKRFGDRITLMGGLDIRTLESNDKDIVRAELKKKLPAAMEGGGYILHTDHSVSTGVEYETYKFFLECGREIGTYGDL